MKSRRFSLRDISRQLLPLVLVALAGAAHKGHDRDAQRHHELHAPLDSHQIADQLSKLEDKATKPEGAEVARESQPLSFITIIGRLHPLIVHFPIGWFMLLLLVEGVALIRDSATLRDLGFPLLGLTILATLPAVTTGLLDAATDLDEAPAAILLWHRNLNIGFSLLLIIAAILRWASRPRLLGSRKLAYIGLLLVAGGLLFTAGHFGGEMVYGEDYLPFF